jgi:SAM-dependent methyltransferase
MFVATRRYVSSVPRTTDAFGAALLDVLAGGDGRHAIERDDGRVDSMNATNYFATADTWTGEIVEALSQMHGRVVDVGCGAGRHALHAASLGCDVVGLEPSPGAIEACRRRRVHANRGRLGDQDIAHDRRLTTAPPAPVRALTVPMWFIAWSVKCLIRARLGPLGARCRNGLACGRGTCFGLAGVGRDDPRQAVRCASDVGRTSGERTQR